jgi:DNA-binding NarL/FixJ family response regulator
MLAASEEMTNHLEARVLREFAYAVVTYFDQGNRQVESETLARALAAAQSTGNFDAFVCAYRAFPPILLALPRLASVETGPFVTLLQSLDRPLAASIGLARPSRHPAVQGNSLTPREREVLELVGQGLTNREISRTLWISESTVKVHVRHLLEKLGARSRTEAATMGRDLPS